LFISLIISCIISSYTSIYSSIGRFSRVLSCPLLNVEQISAKTDPSPSAGSAKHSVLQIIFKRLALAHNAE
jgi:hypothetical protein